MSHQNDIFSPDHTDDASGNISEADMLAYLEGGLSAAERRAIEDALSREGIESDAFDGLQQLDTEEVEDLRNRLHVSLNHHLRKRRRPRRASGDQRWGLLAVCIILLLSLVCYAVFFVLKHPLK